MFICGEGYKEDGKFARQLGVDENTHDSIHDSFGSLVASKYIALIFIVSTLINS